MFSSATGLYPFVNFIFLELPEAAHAMSGHRMFIDPLVYRVTTNAQVFTNLTN